MSLDRNNTASTPYDALLIVSFGGPEGIDDVIPFLENVLRGRNVPRERMLQVAHHYEQFGGVSPLNAQNRALIAALEQEFADSGLNLPIYWGNRNWHPMLADTLRQMAADGIQHALAFVTSAYSSYSSCRQYREDIARAQAEVGENATQVSLLRKFYNHPGFIQPNVENVQVALDQIPAERRQRAHIVFTAHSIPLGMARNSSYETQLTTACQLVAGKLNHLLWRLVYQSRSGAPGQSWLEPDILDHLKSLHEDGVTDVVIAPIGFISDHMEVIYDLDSEARHLADQLGMNMVRAATVGVHSYFIRMIHELVAERLSEINGHLPNVGYVECRTNCCLPAQARPTAVARSEA